jgi:hypothetical protein
MLRLWAAVVIAILLWLGSIAVRDSALDQRKTWPPEENYVNSLPTPDVAPIALLGYREAAADLYWARALVYYGSGVMGENDFRYLTRFIDVILALDPNFKRVYSWAADAVTFKEGKATQEEYSLSLEYLERAMKRYQDDYNYFWRAGLRYWADLHSDDKEKVRKWRERGAELIEEAIHKPNAPADLATLAASMRTKLGQNERAIKMLQQKIMTVSDLAARAKMLNRFEGLTSHSVKDELERAAERFAELRAKDLQQVPPDLFVILGPEPSDVIEFDELATDRSLFGAEQSDEIQLFFH